MFAAAGRPEQGAGGERGVFDPGLAQAFRGLPAGHAAAGLRLAPPPFSPPSRPPFPPPPFPPPPLAPTPPSHPSPPGPPTPSQGGQRPWRVPRDPELASPFPFPVGLQWEIAFCVFQA